MALAFVQEYDVNVAGSSNPSVTLQNPVTKGNLLVAVHIVQGGSASATPNGTIADSAVSSWTQQTAGYVPVSTGALIGYGSIWYGIATSNQTSDTVTITRTSAQNNSVMFVMEFSGINNSVTFDQITNAQTGFSSTVTPVSITPMIVNSIVIAITESNAGAPPWTGITGSSPFASPSGALSVVVNPSQPNHDFAFGYTYSSGKTLTTLGGTWTGGGSSGSQNWSWIFNIATPLTFGISGNAGAAGATVSYTGTASGSVTADGLGNYTISGLLNGNYTIVPSLSNYVFTPTSANETISGSSITGVNFTALSSGYYSVPDCRDYATFPNTSVLVNGTKTYTGQTSSNPAVPGKDSRAGGAPSADGTYPQNNRTPGTYGPGE